MPPWDQCRLVGMRSGPDYLEFEVQWQQAGVKHTRWLPATQVPKAFIDGFLADMSAMTAYMH